VACQVQIIRIMLQKLQVEAPIVYNSLNWFRFF